MCFTDQLRLCEMVDYIQLLDELRTQDFDSIRFASYRMACKIRYLQRRFYFNQIDIWNVIEAVREQSLNQVAPEAPVDLPRVAALLTTLYEQLNKRVPATEKVDPSVVSSALLGWLRATFPSALAPSDPLSRTGAIPALSIKVFLAMLSCGKTVDIYRYIFSLIADSSGWLLPTRLTLFLRAALCIPESLLESPSFSYSDNLSTELFPPEHKYTINNFLQVMLTEPGPQCVLWFPLVGKMAAVEDILHPVSCDACRSPHFYGFRYKCQRCYNYHLCQDCFWKGRTSNQHSLQHQCKEYTTYKPPSKQLGHSLRKSFRCVPERKGDSTVPRVVDRPTTPLNLQHIVPPPHTTPTLTRSTVRYAVTPGHTAGHSQTFGHGPTRVNGSPPRELYSSLDSMAEPLASFISDEFSPDEEHSLIARFSRRLNEASPASTGLCTSAGNLYSSNMNRPQNTLPPERDQGYLDSSASEWTRDESLEEKQLLVARLEARNREMMKEILRLRREVESDPRTMEGRGSVAILAAESPATLEGHDGPVGLGGPEVVMGTGSGLAGISELELLKKRKGDLEEQLGRLQSSRRDLIVHLDELMQMLRFQEPRSASSGSPMTSHSSPSSPGGTVWHRPSGADYQGHFY
ncbi:dystrobrevin beta-like isoform X2 [Varroa jacobsoni]|uniref:ZZ-type domain-containing protein n=1 Tax=Varroa destructor TaxID=109461 RepID=A0A7M7J5P0_VARDE|nr:dystrobrevin beta-like isoform X2 [Varroa destructor]XP_022695029.1 dystrobrevin beta-like isoform X2 [Varroa jacobsoni]